MKRVAGIVLVAGLAVSGCGGSDEPAGQPGESPTSAAPVYLVDGDSDLVNAELTKIRTAEAEARADEAIDECNAATEESFAAWRECLDGYLGPAEAGYRSYAAVLDRLATVEGRSENCVAALGAAADDARSNADLFREIQDKAASDDPDVYLGATEDYYTVIDGGKEGLEESLVEVTSACYAPEVLATLTPTPSGDSTP